MLIHSWMPRLHPRVKHSARLKRESRRLLLESLEGRRLLAFDLALNYAVDARPTSIVTADFNGDGRSDLATANSGVSHGSVSVLLGNADGTFQPAQDFAIGMGATSVAVGDFNADGDLDLVTANSASNDLSVLIGNGTGGFATPRSVALASSHTPLSVAVGDFNADGKMDLVVGARSSTYIPPWSGGYYGGGGGYWFNQAHLNVVMGNGDGGFGTQNSYELSGESTTGISVADLNADGRTDVVAAAGSVHVLLGNGNGSLQSPLHFGTYGNSVAIGDVNSDGKLDLVTPYYGSVGVSLGNGLGGFSFPQYFAAGDRASSVAIADFNRDGQVDLISSDQVSNTVNVLLAAGGGTVAFKPPLQAATGDGPISLAVADFNGDGFSDATSSNYTGTNVSVLLNNAAWPAPNAPSLSITDVTVIEGNTGTVSADFTVSLSAAYSQPVTVRYATADGTATAGSDYQAATGTVTFAPGSTSQRISVLVTGDRVGEDYSESFSVNLSDPTHAFISDGTGSGTIRDDEPRVFIDGYYQVTEGNIGTTPLAFTVTLSAPSDVPVTVDYATADLTADEQVYYGAGATAGVDYIAASGTVTIPAGATSATINVSILGDRIGEPTHENFYVNLSNSSGALINSAPGWGAIVDDEPLVSISGGGEVLEGNSGTKSVTFTASLSAASEADVTVSYTTVDDTALASSDYIAATGTITIPAGQLSRTLTVLIKGDLLVESDEIFNVNLTGASGAVISGYGAWATIRDDDTPPTIAISDASLVEGNSGTKLMTFTLSLSNASSAGVSVNYSTANGSATTSNYDYVAKSGTVSFAPGETTKTITVTIRGDTKKEKDERFYVNLSGASGGTIADGQGVGTIVNDDGVSGGNVKSKNAFAAQVYDVYDAAIADMTFSTQKKRR